MNFAILVGSVSVYLILWALVYFPGAKRLKTKVHTATIRMAMIVISSIAFGFFLSQTVMNPNSNLILLTILFAIGILYNVFKYMKLVQN